MLLLDFFEIISRGTAWAELPFTLLPDKMQSKRRLTLLAELSKQFCTDSAIKVALDVDLFEKWITADEQMTADDLADLTGVDRKLMGK